MKTMLFIYGAILCYLVYNIEVKIKELPNHEKEINVLEKKVK